MSGPRDLLAVVPYLLGFHPRESLVVVWTRSGRVLLTARQDLPPPGEASGVALRCAELADRNGADAMLLIGYGALTDRVCSVLRGLQEALADRRLPEVLCVSDDRFWSLTGEDASCGGRGHRFDHSAEPLAAEAVFAGLALREDRESLARSVAGPPAGDLDRVRRLAATGAAGRLSAADRRAALEDLIGEGLDDPAAVDDCSAVLLAELVRHTESRDQAWSMMEPDTVEAHLGLWSAVVARVPPELAVPPLCLLGVAAWIGGDGALMNVCAERVERLDAHYSMGALLRQISADAVPPTLWRTISGGVRGAFRSRAGPVAG